MKKEKNINYYRDLLHKDSVALLIVAIVFTIVNIWFIGKGEEDAIPIFLKSIMFILFSTIILCNKKETKKFVGILSLVTSCLMILTSIGDGSAFGLIYILLGLLLIAHSILYLTKFKDCEVQSNSSDEIKVKDSKIKYLSIIPIVLTIILVIVSIIVSESFNAYLWCKILILLVNIANIIFCIILHNKKIKSAFTYIILVISILLALLSGMFVIDDVGQIVRKNNKYNSEEYVTETCQSLEKNIEKNITLLYNLTALNIEIGKNAIVSLDDYLNLDMLYKHDGLEELKENDYTCDGYIVLDWNSNLDIVSYHDVTDKLEYPYDMKDYFSDVKSYISCTGKYNYQTNGFDENIINAR